jgi:hypothetical protein
VKLVTFPPGEDYARSLAVMTTKEQAMTIALTSGILGGLVVRSVGLAAGVALAILLLMALFSASI